MFLFFAEAMAHFFRARTIGIRGVRLPIKDDSELLDLEYADNIALYIQNDEMTLERVRLALEVFCMAAEAKINWNLVFFAQNSPEEEEKMQENGQPNEKNIKFYEI